MNSILRNGGCRCDSIRYEVSTSFGPIWNCHCRFCRQVHGAAFTTVAILPRSGFALLSSSGEPVRFVTPQGSVRHFCGACGSPIYNLPREPEILCLVVSSLDTELERSPWAHVNVESKAPWFAIGDALPQFPGMPDAEGLARLVAENLPVAS